LYAELLPLMNSGRVELLDQPRLLAQLASLERRTARSGRDTIDHPPGAHDDVANAAAGAIALVAEHEGAAVAISLSWARGESGGASTLSWSDRGQSADADCEIDDAADDSGRPTWAGIGGILRKH
jgi:hypothetical protein